jgi:prepilin-type N-terminal cleavage/methylation domain-containing protein
MRQRIMAARKNEGGFTLIELLIVIVILGVLSGIVVFAVQAFNNDGKTAACEADYKNVEIAAEAYLAKVHSPAANYAAVVPTYLKEQPSSADYTISLVNGAVSASGACTH